MRSKGSSRWKIRDRIEAIRRVPAYKQDFSKWTELRERAKLKKTRTVDSDLEQLDAFTTLMRRKWKLIPPFPPLAEVPLEKWERLRFVYPFDELKAVEVIDPFDNNKQTVIQRMISEYDPLWLKADYKSYAREHGTRRMQYRGGKHLCMIVDLTRSKKKLLREAEGYFDYYQRMLPLQNTRSKPTIAVDIWEVHDLAQNGCSVAHITRRLMKSHPMVDSAYTAAYNAVTRALKKTAAMIKEVESTS